MVIGLLATILMLGSLLSHIGGSTTSVQVDAAWILDGQKTLFTTQTPVKPGSTIHYYLDDTIFAVTWKQTRPCRRGRRA